MKPVILSTAILFAAGIVFTSCKKSYNCTCKSAWTQQWYDTDIKAKSKKTADAECQKLVSPEVDGPTECHLK